MSWVVYYFCTQNGKLPVKEYVESASLTDKAKIVKSIEYLKEFGPLLRTPHSKKLAPNLFELRILGETSLRILYSPSLNGFCLLHIFQKKTQKTPEKEIKTAVDRMKTII